MTESVLWTILPVGLRQLTGRLFQPNPFLFTLWIMGRVGKAALVVPKPKKRAMQVDALHVEHGK